MRSCNWQRGSESPCVCIMKSTTSHGAKACLGISTRPGKAKASATWNRLRNHGKPGPPPGTLQVFWVRKDRRPSFQGIGVGFSSMIPVTVRFHLQTLRAWGGQLRPPERKDRSFSRCIQYDFGLHRSRVDRGSFSSSRTYLSNAATLDSIYLQSHK